MNQSDIDYATYNIWANNRHINKLLEQDDSLLTKELVASYSTIRDTILHIWYAETGWLSRLKGHGWIAEGIIGYSGTNKELFQAWQKTSKDLKHFVETADIEKKISFDHKGENFSIPSREIIHTICTHGSYHRGQIVMMMRQLGISDIPQTDYIEWARIKSKA